MAQVGLRELREQAEQALAAGAVERAAALAQQMLRAYPGHAGAHRLLGLALLHAGQHEAAARELEQALAVDPEDVQARIGLARTLLARRQRDAGRAELARALDLCPGDQAVRRQVEGLRDAAPGEGQLSGAALGRLYLHGGLLPQAVAQLASVRAQGVQRAEISLGLAEAYWRAGQVEEAVEVCQELLQAQPRCLKALLILGHCWASDGMPEEGKVLLHTAGLLDPENEMAAALAESLPPPWAGMPAPLAEWVLPARANPEVEVAEEAPAPFAAAAPRPAPEVAQPAAGLATTPSGGLADRDLERRLAQSWPGAERPPELTSYAGTAEPLRAPQLEPAVGSDIGPEAVEDVTAPALPLAGAEPRLEETLPELDLTARLDTVADASRRAPAPPEPSSFAEPLALPEPVGASAFDQGRAATGGEASSDTLADLAAVAAAEPAPIERLRAAVRRGWPVRLVDAAGLDTLPAALSTGAVWDLRPSGPRAEAPAPGASAPSYVDETLAGEMPRPAAEEPPLPVAPWSDPLAAATAQREPVAPVDAVLPAPRAPFAADQPTVVELTLPDVPTAPALAAPVAEAQPFTPQPGATGAEAITAPTPEPPAPAPRAADADVALMGITGAPEPLAPAVEPATTAWAAPRTGAPEPAGGPSALEALTTEAPEAALPPFSGPAVEEPEVAAPAAARLAEPEVATAAPVDEPGRASSTAAWAPEETSARPAPDGAPVPETVAQAMPQQEGASDDLAHFLAEVREGLASRRIPGSEDVQVLRVLAASGDREAIHLLGRILVARGDFREGLQELLKAPPSITGRPRGV